MLLSDTNSAKSGGEGRMTVSQNGITDGGVGNPGAGTTERGESGNSVYGGGTGRGSVARRTMLPMRSLRLRPVNDVSALSGMRGLHKRGSPTRGDSSTAGRVSNPGAMAGSASSMGLGSSVNIAPGMELEDGPDGIGGVAGCRRCLNIDVNSGQSSCKSLLTGPSLGTDFEDEDEAGRSDGVEIPPRVPSARSEAERVGTWGAALKSMTRGVGSGEGGVRGRSCQLNTGVTRGGGLGTQ